MAKKDHLLPQNLSKFNFFGKYFQAKKLKSAKNGSLPPSIMYFISFYIYIDITKIYFSNFDSLCIFGRLLKKKINKTFLQVSSSKTKVVNIQYSNYFNY